MRIDEFDAYYRLGVAQMDDSVLAAVASVRRIPELPDDFVSRHRTITIVFELKSGL